MKRFFKITPLVILLFLAGSHKAFSFVPAKSTTGVSTVTKGASSIWTATKSRTAVQNAYKHWLSHGAEFPGIKNAKQYVDSARNFMNNSPAGTLLKTRANGDILKYHPASNTFGVMNKAGEVRTMFKPTDGMQYWLGQ